ncbi:hypothetical protein [Pseudokineococcus marinus]|uniref:HNH endonuclease n=1 Tax=Pseudokineococcus marinus TaxID=351215 RepID=A0A849BLN2_9ACTN|nr:hypothetical protein [Pseudokineococcus marinus]NNH21712.1 hypothetical protein [Pseudokineococcus marinus]
MSAAPITPAAARRLRCALSEADVVERYRAKTARVDGHSCLFWIGAVSGRGHGRLWVGTDEDGRNVAVIAHRFGYGLAHGWDALAGAPVVTHACDNPLCQEPGHWRAGTHTDNRLEWAWRRHQLAGPLRDLRGARGRALAVRDAVRDGRPLDDVLTAGTSEGDRDQLPLWC